jgi:DNA (cytosine-5)-methyltransferase 1
MGYHRAGFDVVGVDVKPQPNYPFEFIHEDALGFLESLIAGDGIGAIHASPPCQAYSPLNAYNGKDYPDLVDPVRALLLQAGLPYVIENVPQAPLLDPVRLCGSMFGLRIYRHRAFESSVELDAPRHTRHVARCARNGYLPNPAAPFMSIHGGRHSKAWVRAAAEQMGVPWMSNVREVCEAIPPAYTEHIGQFLMAECAASLPTEQSA